ncbi:MAG: nitroreductase family protein [archaeon]
MDALECIASRRSIRRFLDMPIDKETIMDIIDAGHLAPSSGNVQDWRFIVVDDKPLMKKLSEHSLGQDSVHNAAFLIVVCGDPEQTERHYGLRGSRLYLVQNCAAAIENMLLAAHAMDIGGVWIGAFDEDKIKVLLDIPTNVRPQAILAFGYPSEKPDTRIVKDLDVITYFNRYGGKIKHMHLAVRDFSVEWEKRISQAYNIFGRFKEKTKELTKETSEKISKEGGSLLKEYKEKLGDKLKPKK